MALWNSTGGQSRHPLPGHGMLPLVARGTPTSKVLLAWTLLSQLTDSLLRSRRGASVFSIPAGNRERFADICEPNSALTVQRQRKRPGGAVGSRPARKRSRLLPSSAGGTLQTEPRDLEESGAPAFEPGEEVIDLTGEEVIDLTGEDVIDLPGGSSEPEVITLSDNESPVDREQSQQQPHLSRASENSVEPLARNDEEEPIEDDGDWLRFTNERPFRSGEDSEAREQNQQHSQLSRAAENSAGPVATRDEEEPRDNDGAQTAGPASLPMREGDNSQVQDREQSQQHPLGSREAESSAELRASDNEEEPRDSNDSINSDEWPDRFESPPTWQDDITDDWEGSQQYSLHSTSTEDSVELVPFNLLMEPRDIEFERLRSLVSPPHWEDDNAECDMDTGVSEVIVACGF
ncbi:uncharacterized protein LOC134418951 [Melospiza melodia melodia]|uniref:uncharacterized protein LOC134418951 n=1 Tax=Melospiza melodia melodia TaxID=1914991 RepID=UPI002FCFA22F